jgi:chromosome segregation ATPase
LPQRDRRGQDRNRGRQNRQQFPSSHHGGGYQQGGGGQSSHPREQGQETLRGEGGQQPAQSGASILADVRAEVERLREVLEGVLRDLEDVSEQLMKAEHEKDIAETEIEQLRDQLRRLHR